MASESSETAEQLADVARRRFPKDIKSFRRTFSASHPQESAELNKQTSNPIHCTQVVFVGHGVGVRSRGLGRGRDLKKSEGVELRPPTSFREKALIIKFVYVV